MKLHDILIFMIIENAYSLGRVGEGKEKGVKWARFMTTPGNYCNDWLVDMGYFDNLVYM